MESVLSLKEKVLSYSTFKVISITVCFALLYYIISIVTIGASANAQMLVGGSTFKVANMLRAFVLSSPFAVIGTTIGAWFFNLTTGFSSVGAYSVIPVAIAGLGILFNKLSNFIGRSYVKDLGVLFLFGVTSALIVYSNLVTMLVVLGSSVSIILFKMVLSKIVLHGFTVMSGYPFLKFIETIADKINKQN